MSFNPFFNNYGGFINYGFSSPFFYNSYAYGMGYPFFPRPIDFYFNPYSEFLGNYYWYFRFYRSRFGPWYNGGMYDSSYSYKGDKKIMIKLHPQELLSVIHHLEGEPESV